MSGSGKRKVKVQVCMHCGHRMAVYACSVVGYKYCPGCGLRVGKPRKLRPPPAPSKGKGGGEKEGG